MKTSIIIPIYNVVQYIERCLQSALNQTYENIEIILIDDVGTDNSMEIVHTVICNHNRWQCVKIIKHQKNRGLSAARNTGINSATGEYIFFLDGDDAIFPNCIELLSKSAISFKPDFVIADYQTIGSDIIYPPLKLNEGRLTSNEHILISYLNSEWYMMAWNKLINKAFLTSNQLYFEEGLIHEDNLWSFQLACKAQSAYVIKNTTYNYFIQGGSITQNPSAHNFNSYIKIIDSMIKFVKKEKLTNNNDIYNFIETLKSIFFYKINNSNLSDHFKYNSYQKIRENNYKFIIIYILQYKFLKSRMRTKLHTTLLVHYLLPTNLGFTNYKKSTSRFFSGD